MSGDSSDISGGNIPASLSGQLPAVVAGASDGYRSLFELSDQAVFRFSDQGLLQEMNQRAVELIGPQADEMVGRHFSSFSLLRHRQRLDRVFQQVKQGHRHTLELTTADTQDRRLVLRLSVIPQMGDSATVSGLFVVVQDMTQQRLLERQARRQNRELVRRVVQRTADLIRTNRQLQAEIIVRQAAQQAADHLAAIVAFSDDAIIRLASDGMILSWNAAAERLYGYRPSEVIGCSLKCLCPSDGQVVGQMLDRISRGEHVAHFEMPLRRQDGSLVEVSLALSPVCDGQGQVIGASAIARDMTQRKQMEQAIRQSEERYRQLAQRLQAMTVQLSMVEEQERRQVALDLHDGLGQTLTLSKIKLNQLQQRPDLTTAQIKSLLEIERLIEQANQSVRSLTFQISPPVLYDLGLVPALQWLAEDLLRQYDFDVAIREAGGEAGGDVGGGVGGGQTIKDYWPVVLFRAVRELLLNAFKHSGAKQASVSLFTRDAHFCIEVRDRGSGFDPQAGNGRGFGLLSIQQRVCHLGGTFDVQSVAGHGTCVTLGVPLAENHFDGGH